jgi:hypothetical protein
MAVTITNLKRIAAGNYTRVVGTITGPASYTTGGETLTAAQIATLTTVPVSGGNRSTTSLTSLLTFDSETEPANLRSIVLDRTNVKVKFVAGSTEVASTTNLSAVSINFEAVTSVANG